VCSSDLIGRPVIHHHDFHRRASFRCFGVYRPKILGYLVRFIMNGNHHRKDRIAFAVFGSLRRYRLAARRATLTGFVGKAHGLKKITDVRFSNRKTRPCYLLNAPPKGPDSSHECQYR